MSGPDLILADRKFHATFLAELAADHVASQPGFRDLDWRKQKRLKNKARRQARATARTPIGKLMDRKINEAMTAAFAKWGAMWFEAPASRADGLALLTADATHPPPTR